MKETIKKRYHAIFIAQYFVHIFSSIIVLLFIASSAYASSREDLTRTKAQLDEAKEKQKEIAQTRETLESELTQRQRQLVAAAAQLKQHEAALTEAEEKLARIEAKLQAKERELKTRRETLATMIEAALRISRIPPEAMMLLPQDGEQAVRAARILKMTSDGIKNQSEQIRLQLEELLKLKETLDRQHEIRIHEAQRLKQSFQEMERQIDIRRELQKKIRADEQRQAEAIAKLSKQAQSLQDLIGRIEIEREARTAQAEETDSAQAIRGRLRSFNEARGDIGLPVIGQVIQNFGNATGRNETSRGMVIKTRPQASVTAPFDGEVVYAGTFMGYGKLVILRHSDDFHTLLSGLADINTRSGEFLLEGEPIGAMGDKDSSTRLYLELRRNNQPVDPAAWIKH